MTYNKVTPEIIAQLQQIVGSTYVIHDDQEKLEPFSHDEVPGEAYASMPEVAVRPGSAEEISQIMKIANRENIPVTPRGAGSGLSGGAVPIYGGIVMLTDRMNRILEVDVENMVIVVEPGVITSEINEAISSLGLFYAGYPMSLETCFIGGNVAENAGGGKAVKYGVTSRYVLGLDIVTPTGDMIELGGKLVKDVTGYNMIGLMVGSEGTLGIFTKIILKLMPLPKSSVDLLCLFKSPEDAIAAVPMIMTEGGVIPTAIEFMDQISVRAACEYLNETIDYEKAGAMLLITVDGSDIDMVQAQYEAIGEQCMAAGAIEVYVADNATTSERVWKIRRNVAEAFSLASMMQGNEDLVVPIAKIPDLVKAMAKLSKKHDVIIPAYGHAGDGNLHTRITPKPDCTEEKWNEILPVILDELYDITAAMGGRLSGEHGIGSKRKKYMSHFVSQEYLNMIRSIKRALDPNNVLNPGKIFDV